MSFWAVLGPIRQAENSALNNVRSNLYRSLDEYDHKRLQIVTYSGRVDASVSSALMDNVRMSFWIGSRTYSTSWEQRYSTISEVIFIDQLVIWSQKLQNSSVLGRFDALVYGSVIETSGFEFLTCGSSDVFDKLRDSCPSTMSEVNLYRSLDISTHKKLLQIVKRQTSRFELFQMYLVLRDNLRMRLSDRYLRQKFDVVMAKTASQQCQK